MTTEKATTAPTSIEDIRKDIIALSKSNSSPKKEHSKAMFAIKTANTWTEEARARPTPKMLFSELWYEGEVCIMFADTNVGKSILAVQIADSISKGQPIKGFKLEATACPVLYMDFELSDKQFEMRYARKQEDDSFGDHYRWSDDLLRAEISPDVEVPDKMSFEEYLNISMDTAIADTGAKVLIVDNITYLKNETERAKDATPLMKYLKQLKTKHNLSLLVLAHTPKRDMSKPITRNDLSGSKMLINFCDSSFSIGESVEDKSLRYIKQIKARNTEFLYDAENVIVCQIDKPENFLQFELVSYGHENEYIRTRSDDDSNAINDQVIELHRQGLSYREIGNSLGVSHMKASRIVKSMSTVTPL